jgi:hypothetical protein
MKQESAVSNAPSSNPNRAPSPGPHEIERRARAIWEEEGRPDGRSTEHWLAAERELRARSAERDGPDAASPKNEYKEAERGTIVAGPSAGRTAPVGKPPASKLLAGRQAAGPKPEPDPSAPLSASKRGARGGSSRA